MTSVQDKDQALLEDQVWTGLVAGGITHAISGLSEMVGQPVRTTFLAPRTLPAAAVSTLVGDPEDQMVAIHLGVEGEASGHIMVAFQPQTAVDLLGLLLGEKPSLEEGFSELEVSAMGEMGNIMGAYFLSALGDVTNVELRPTPPTVMMDMAAAVIDAAVADLMMYADDVLVVDTRFGTTDQQIRGVFLVLPNPELKAVLLDKWQD
ncbi:MAG: chemotaxis protein CheX [Chloroflexi bacterium]|nr:chemotaxis protein CheX [Chloroflexota bacterium]